MSRINEKLGLKPAGKRNMMKLPDDRVLRAAVTSARCPKCNRTGANLSKTEKTPHLFCTHCGHIWPLILCHVCRRPATCVGEYETCTGNEQPACDDCCGHGNEDGHCRPIAENA